MRMKVGMDDLSVGELLRRNAVALISLFIAVTSLAYNTWRNETTKYQRNLGHVSFELMEALADLRARVDSLAYRSAHRDHWIGGWGAALTIQGLGQLMSDSLASSTERLRGTWQLRGEERLFDDERRRRQASRALLTEIRATRTGVLGVLAGLD